MASSLNLVFDAAFDLSLTDGRVCAVRTAVPAGPAPGAGWPAAYVLDAHQFDRMRADPGGLPGVLVGLAPTEPSHRAWDYTPRVAGRAAPPSGVHGDAARWLRVLEQARTEIRRRHRLDPDRQVLCGHSLGALFALYVMTHRPRAFNGYVLSSPSVWWGEHYAQRLLRRRRAWLCRQGLPALGVYLTVGEHEQGLGPDDAAAAPEERARREAMRQSRGMVDGMWLLAGTLGQCDGLRLHSAVLPGRSHRTAAGDALMPGWRWLLEGTSGDSMAVR